MSGFNSRSPRTLIFGNADYWKPDVAEAPLWEARRLYFEAVLEAEPEVLGELRDHVLPLYLKWNGKPAISRVRLGPKPYFETPKLIRNPEFAHWFVSWMRCYRLEADWARETALCTLAQWKAGLPKDRWHYPPVPVPVRSSVPAKFDFRHPGIPLTGTTRKQVAKAIRSQFENELATYLDWLERNYEKAGYQKTPRKNARTANEHFRWLAEYQVRNLSAQMIQRQWDKTATTQMVERAIRKTARFIGLPLRGRTSWDEESLRVTFPPCRDRLEEWYSGATPAKRRRAIKKI